MANSHSMILGGWPYSNYRAILRRVLALRQNRIDARPSRDETRKARYTPAGVKSPRLRRPWAAEIASRAPIRQLRASIPANVQRGDSCPIGAVPPALPRLSQSALRWSRVGRCARAPARRPRRAAAQNDKPNSGERRHLRRRQFIERRHPPDHPPEAVGPNPSIFPRDDDERRRDCKSEQRSATQDGKDCGLAHLGIENRCGQGERQHHQYGDNRAGENIEPSSVDPRPEHRLVVAQQQQEHSCARQQHAGQGLHGIRQQPERCAGREQKGSRQRDETEPWSLTSLREKLIKIGAKVVSHGRYVTFQMAEVAVPRQMFADILSLIARLRSPPAPA